MTLLNKAHECILSRFSERAWQSGDECGQSRTPHSGHGCEDTGYSDTMGMAGKGEDSTSIVLISGGGNLK